MPFYLGYKTETTPELLEFVKTLNFKGYEKYFERNTNGDFNHRQNFFIWMKKNKNGVINKNRYDERKQEYIRITLQSNNLKGDYLLFFWNVETSFKPFNYEHNHREGANKQIGLFKANDDKKYFDDFLVVVEFIEEYLKQ